MSARTAAAPLAGRAVFTLRPAGESRSLLRRLRALGAVACNLPVQRLHGAAAGTVLPRPHALSEDDRWLFSSPVAVRHLARIDAERGGELLRNGGVLVRAGAAGRVFAPGPGTVRALARVGVSGARAPQGRLDSEGVLELPELAPPLHGHLYLVGAPGGRGLLARILTERGLCVEPVWVYRRVPAALASRLRAALDAAVEPMLIVSSTSAFTVLIEQLSPQALDRLRGAAMIVAASPRLAQQVRELGFRRVHTAASARPEALAHAAASWPIADSGSMQA